MLLKIRPNYHSNLRCFHSLNRRICLMKEDDQKPTSKLLYSNHLNQINQINQIRKFTFDPIQWSINLNVAVRNSFYVDYTQKFLIKVHDSLGIPWCLEIVLISLALRGLLMLPVSIYERRLTAKMDLLSSSEVTKKINDIREISRRKLQLREFRTEKQAALWFNTQRRKVYKEFYLKHNMHPAKRIVAILSPAPVWMVMSFSIGNLCARTPPNLLEKKSIIESIFASKPQLSNEGLLWFQNLTLPDPYLIIPVFFSLTLFASIEYNVLTRRFNLVDDTLRIKIITNGLRSVALLLALTTFVAPSGLTLYWLVNSSTGLLQNVLLSKKTTRKVLRIPETVSSQNLPGFIDLGVHLLNKVNFVNYFKKLDKKI